MSDVAERVTSAELTDWMAFERVCGSMLVHERIDAGFAQVSLILAKAFGGDKAKRLTPRHFMPPWYQELTAEDELKRGMGQLLKLAHDAND